MVKRLPTVQETRVQSLGREDLLEKEMATHSSILAWKVPWTEKPFLLKSRVTKQSDAQHFGAKQPQQKRTLGLPRYSVVENLPADVEDLGSIPG